MRNRMIAGNWKMNKTSRRAPSSLTTLSTRSPTAPTTSRSLSARPPSTSRSSPRSRAGLRAFTLGAQNVYWEASGAYTGETAPDMLKAVGATYCIIGHSERRDYFDETDEDENKKAKALVAAGLVPVFCCGEPLEVREAGTHVEHVVDQVKDGLEGLEITDPAQFVVAYEPIWAIGTGMTATADDAQEVCAAVRETLADLFGAELASGIRVLYGGSAKPDNIAELIAKPDVDGALVGGASLKADSFAAMVKSAMA